MAYEWHVPLDVARTTYGNENHEIPYISAFFTPAKSLNEHFYEKKSSIIDLKNTKTELFIIDGKHII